MISESGMLSGERFVLEYSKRNRTWALRHPIDRRRAWREPSLLELVETTTRSSVSYRYDIDGHDSNAFQPHSHSFEGVLLAVAGHPYTFSIPDRLRGDYSQQELDLIDRWQRLLVAGIASDDGTPPIDAMSLTFRDALRIMDEYGRFDEHSAAGEDVPGIVPQG